MRSSRGKGWCTPSTAHLMLLLTALLAVPFAQGCAAGAAPLAQQATSSPLAATTTSGSYILKVTEGDRVLARLSLDDIEKLPSVKLTADGKEQEGPTLLSVLGRAGVTDFQRVTVVGMQRGRTHSASLTLDQAKITDRLLLDINQRGQTKLAGPDLPSEVWVVDVSDLRVVR